MKDARYLYARYFTSRNSTFYHFHNKRASKSHCETQSISMYINLSNIIALVINILQRKMIGKKRNTRKRKPKLAPRYASSAKKIKGSHVNNEQQVQLVRELLRFPTCRCFVLKCFSEANFHKSLKFGIWSTTRLHNALLNQVYKSMRPILFFFSVCGTKHFSGIARMTSEVRTDVQFQLWEKLKYEGFFHVEWLLVKDVPNFVLTGIKMSNTPTKKSITSCRDCEEVLFDEVRGEIASCQCKLN